MKMTDNKQSKIRVLIADDHGIMRRGLELIIANYPNIDIVAQADNGLIAVDLCRKLKPDIVLMDISMPGLNGIDAAREIRAENPDIKIIALSAHSNLRFIRDMIAAGASGYILKESISDDLIEAINTVCSGNIYLTPQITGVFLADCITPDQNAKCSSPLELLTTKERQVLQLIAENKTTTQAAKMLHISPKTVEARRLKMMKKLGLDSVVSLTKLAIREGITTLDF